MWAGYLALLNQKRASHGLSSIGFINPSVYKAGLSKSYDNDFNDILSGSNGYQATKGYDLATGWGSPKAGNSIVGDVQ
jgi:hypothetical protein